MFLILLINLLQFTSCAVIQHGISNSSYVKNQSKNSNRVLLSCEFDDGAICDEFELDSSGNFDWKLAQSSSSSLTGPSEDASGNGYYIYIDSSEQYNGNVARFHTRDWYNVKASRKGRHTFNYCLQFKYHMKGLTIGSLSVHFLTERKKTLMFRLVGEKNNDWQLARIPFRGDNSWIRIVFEANTSIGYTSDIAVDSIKLEHIKKGDQCWRWPVTQIEDLKKPASCTEYQPEDRSTCGYKANMNYIIGGNETRPGEWPWMAMLCRKNTNENFCGGTLLGNRWIVTAAHCVYNMETADSIFVKLGAYRNPSTKSKNCTVNKVFIHPKYNMKYKYNYDVALIKLNESVQHRSTIGSICLPNLTKPLPSGKKCHVTGWGDRSRKDGDVAHVLRAGEVEIQDWEECRSAYEKGVSPTPLSLVMMCAGKKVGRVTTDTCRGDSGGPLMYRNEYKQWELGGITSWGSSAGCGNPTKFGVYTNVAVVQDWIRGVIKCEPDDNRLIFETHRKEFIRL